MRRITVVLLLLGALSAGCTGTKVRPITGFEARPDSLAFLAAGETDRDETVRRIGKPSRSYEDGRLVVYRLDKEMQATSSWTEARFSLILVFDERDVLQRHGIVRVK